MFASVGAAMLLVFSGAGSAHAMLHGSRITLSRATQPTTFREFVSFVPVTVGGVVNIYGLIVSVLIASRIDASLSLDDGYRLFGAGLCMGGTGLFSGLAMGKFYSAVANQASEETCVEDGRENSENQALLSSNTFREKSSKKFICVLLIFEAGALYGLIASLVLIGDVPK